MRGKRERKGRGGEQRGKWRECKRGREEEKDNDGERKRHCKKDKRKERLR